MGISYHDIDFPLFQNYTGMIHNYIVFLVLRFYDDVNDFILKLKSLSGHVEVYKVEKLFSTQVVLYSKVYGVRVVLSKRDDRFTLGVKLLHVLFGDDFIMNRIAVLVLTTLTDDDFELAPNYMSQKIV